MQERKEAGAGTGRPINAIPESERTLAAILSEWRDAERALAETHPGTVEASAAAANVRRLREEYKIAHELRTKPTH
jgi:hypothetical protein